MDGSVRSSSPDLKQQVLAAPYRYELFQALRVLDQASTTESLALRTPATLAFPPSELSEARHHASSMWELDVSVMGLTGPSGVMPHVYTEWLQQRKIYQKDHAAHAFLDVFSQRFIELFYESWVATQPALRFERNEQDHFIHYLQDLVGLGSKGQWQDGIGNEENDLNARFTAYFSGQLIKRPASAEQIEEIITAYFNVPVRVDAFCAHNISLDNERSVLGIHGCQLGVDTALGDTVTQHHDRFTIVLGPLRSLRFMEFLQGSSNAEAIASLVRFCFGHELSCELHLILHKDDLLTPQLGGDAQLGLTTFMSSSAPSEHSEDVRFVLVH